MYLINDKNSDAIAYLDHGEIPVFPPSHVLGHSPKIAKNLKNAKLTLGSLSLSNSIPRASYFPVKNSAERPNFEKGPARWFITVLATRN